MTKKHFVAMADYIAKMLRYRPEMEDHIRREGAYELALHLANTFGERFDRVRFDAYIEKHSKV